MPQLANSLETFTEVSGIIEKYQIMLQDNEATIAELEASLTDLEEKTRVLSRRAERTELEHDDVLQRCDDSKHAASQLKAEVTPLIESFMEAEVLKTQYQALKVDLVRVENECEANQQELADLLPRVSEEEALQAQGADAIVEMEAAHVEESSALKSLHMQEISETSASHGQRITDLEAGWLEELTTLRLHNLGDIAGMRTSIEEARWQAEVYAREQHEIVQEIGIRQSENTRLARRCHEARQEASELAVKLEALKASESGAPVKDVKFQALEQQQMIQQRMYSEWRKALERKNEECKVWRQKAIGRGARQDAVQVEDVEALLSTPAESLEMRRPRKRNAKPRRTEMMNCSRTAAEGGHHAWSWLLAEAEAAAQ